jgi:hypothetical protein
MVSVIKMGSAPAEISAAANMLPVKPPDGSINNCIILNELGICNCVWLVAAHGYMRNVGD